MNNIVYEYGVRLDAECVARVNHEFWLAHQLYNSIVATIRDVRKEANDFLLSKSEEARFQKRALDDHDEAFKAARSVEDVDAMKAAKEGKRTASKAMWDALKGIKKEYKDELKAIYDKIGMRRECETYKHIETFTSQGLGRTTADMIHTTALRAWQSAIKNSGEISFRKAAERISDHIDVRFTSAGGIDAQELLSGRHNSISLGEPGVDGHAFNGARARHYPGFRFRIGPAKDKIFATGTWKPEREIPEGARVTTCRLVRKRIGPDVKWTIQLQLAIPEREQIQPAQDRKPYAAMHCGWSLADTGSIRVAAISSDADSGFSRFIDMPYSIPFDIQRASALLKERDEKRDEFVEDVIKFSKPSTRWTDAEREEFDAIKRLPAQHVSQRRLAKLDYLLREYGAQWPELSEFVKEDKVLYRAQRHIETRARNRRRDWYRKLAHKLVAQFEAIEIAIPDLKEAAKRRKDDGERSELGQIARTARTHAALYEFKQAIEQASIRAGCTILYSKKLAHANVCAGCGSDDIERCDDRIQCHKCGHEEDAKANAAAVLFQQRSNCYMDDVIAANEASSKAAEEAVAKKQERLKRMSEQRHIHGVEESQSPRPEGRGL